MGIFDHSSRSAFVRSDTDVGREGLARSLRSNSSQRCSIGLRSGLCAGQSSSSTPNSLIHVFMRWRSVIRHSRERVSTALESSVGVLYTTASDALHCTWWCMLGCSCSAMETHSMKLSTHCSWANLKATWTLEVCSDWFCRKLATSAHYAPQHPLTPLCHFTWPTTSWLSCCHSQSLPLCYNTTDSWLWNI